LGQLRKIHGQLLELGYQIVAISPDRPERVREILDKSDVEYTLLSDDALAAARALGVAFRVDDAGYARLKGFGIDLEERSGQAHHLLPVPAVLILDKTGRIRFSYVNPDYKVRVAPEVLLEAAKAAKKK